MTEPISQGTRFNRLCRWLALIPLFLLVIYVIITSCGGDAFIIGVGLIAFAAGCVLMAPVALYRVWELWPERRTVITGLALMVIATIVSISVVRFANWPLRRWAFSCAAERADEVVNAIKRFDQVEGRLPTSLSELVPVYLKYVPDTGLWGYPSFEYEVLSSQNESVVWWDLGSRGGASPSGLWVYPDGNPDHAILAVEFDNEGKARSASVDRMPESTTTRPFDSDLWRTRPEQRQQMIRDFATQHELGVMDQSAFEVLLGAPSGTRSLGAAPWELRIPCSKGMLNWDVFFYWPTEDYPDYAYGGGIERIGRWAYVHE